MNQYSISSILIISIGLAECFHVPLESPKMRGLFLAKGFGPNNRRAKKKNRKQNSDSIDSFSDTKSGIPKSRIKPYVKGDQQGLIETLASKASKSELGRAVEETTNEVDPFWELMPSLIMSRFPKVSDNELKRVAGFFRHTLDPALALEDEIVHDTWRPHQDVHAYMPGLGPTKPFHDPSSLKLCSLLRDNFATIKTEYAALLDEMSEGGIDRFQSVTSMNYDSGWQTLVLFYNGHRIPTFPYHLCPTTTRILESVPLAGRIAGFNRQQPRTGIPLHSDGNNMWLTCQMGLHVPEDSCWIRVGPEKRRWKAGECLLYDTTYEHETMNEHQSQERVVLHVDFFNTLAMTPIEIEVMQYIYSLREEFMKAEGVSKVGDQVL